MNKIIMPIAVVAIIGMHDTANAYCTDWGNQAEVHYDLSKCTDRTTYFDGGTNCSSLDEVYTFAWTDNKGCYYVRSCGTCPSGYKRELEDTGWRLSDLCYVEDSAVDAGLQQQPLEVYRCKKECASCTNCTSSNWEAYGTGYQRMINRDCNCDGTCQSTTKYRCAAGYYGTSTNGTSGCTRCPSSGGVYGTSIAGATAITSCYIPKDTTLTDSYGNYVFTSNCYYKN